MENAPKAARGLARTLAVSGAGLAITAYELLIIVLLAPVITAQLFPGSGMLGSTAFALLALTVSLAARPGGGLLFGAMADRSGRVKALRRALLLMAAAGFLSALVPPAMGFASVAAFAALRLAFGLGVGGAQTAASVLSAEAPPPGKRGLFSSIPQSGGILGAIAALGVILGLRAAGLEPMAWRGAFIALAAVALVAWWAAQGVDEPALEAVKDAAPEQANKNPFVLQALALLGLTMGAGVVTYVGLVHGLVFLEQTMRVEPGLARTLFAVALVLAAPFYILFGWLSDKVGRKWVIVAGCLVAALAYYPLFNTLSRAANPRLVAAGMVSPVIVAADPDDCSFQFLPNSGRQSSCDLVKGYLTRAGVAYEAVGARAGQAAFVQIGPVFVEGFEPDGLPPVEYEAQRRALEAELATTLEHHGYPAKADPALIRTPMVVGILFLLALFAAMVQAPLAAMLSELFPARNRAASVAWPQQIGAGWFGGLVAPLSFALVALTGNIFFGLIYVIGVAGLTVIVGSINLPETKDRDIAA